MSRRGEYNAYLRSQHIPIIQSFCDENGLEWHFVNDFEWHIRIDNKLDVYPTRKRWCWLPNEHRGGFKDFEELQDIYFTELKELEK